jgi:hypothetical protein
VDADEHGQENTCSRPVPRCLGWHSAQVHINDYGNAVLCTHAVLPSEGGRSSAQALV